MAKKKASGRKYGKAASKSVKKALHKEKRGQLKSGRSGRKVTNPKQAIAIGLSEAREKGAKVPPPKKGKKKSAATKDGKKRPATKDGKKRPATKKSGKK